MRPWVITKKPRCDVVHQVTPFISFLRPPAIINDYVHSLCSEKCALAIIASINKRKYRDDTGCLSKKQQMMPIIKCGRNLMFCYICSTKKKLNYPDCKYWQNWAYPVSATVWCRDFRASLSLLKSEKTNYFPHSFRTKVESILTYMYSNAYE